MKKNNEEKASGNDVQKTETTNAIDEILERIKEFETTTANYYCY